jgi:hypothetical protein
MILLLNPLLEALEAARRAAGDATDPADEVTVDDQGNQWVFEFIPRGESLGGGARVWVSKEGFQVLHVIRGQ